MDKLLISQIYQLPESLKLEVLHYIEFLKSNYQQELPSKSPKKRKAGSAKGKYKIADDFDAPLDDFKEYMG